MQISPSNAKPYTISGETFANNKAAAWSDSNGKTSLRHWCIARMQKAIAFPHFMILQLCSEPACRWRGLNDEWQKRCSDVNWRKILFMCLWKASSYVIIQPNNPRLALLLSIEPTQSLDSIISTVLESRSLSSLKLHLFSYLRAQQRAFVVQ